MIGLVFLFYEIMAETNPNNANQYVMDPRQKLCWELYVNPKSETFGNATQSAIKAGYEASYADVITTRPWFEGKVRRLGMLEKAEKVLDEMLEMPVEVQEVEGYGDEKELVVNTSPALVKIKQDTAKFIAERVGKNEGYSARTELTGADGQSLLTNLSDLAEEHERKQGPGNLSETEEIPDFIRGEDVESDASAGKE